MRKGALLLAVLMVAAAPSMAMAKKAKRVAPKPDPAAAEMQQSRNFMGEGLHQLVVPFESMSGVNRTATPAKPAKKVRHAKRHRAKKKMS